MTKSRKESFIFKKQTSKLKMRRPSAGFEDTQECTALMAPHSQGHGATMLIHWAFRQRTHSARLITQVRAGRRVSLLVGDQDTCPDPASAVRYAGQFQASLCLCPLGISLPGGAARQRLEHVAHTSYHGNAAIWQRPRHVGRS